MSMSFSIIPRVIGLVALAAVLFIGVDASVASLRAMGAVTFTPATDSSSAADDGAATGAGAGDDTSAGDGGSADLGASGTLGDVGANAVGMEGEDLGDGGVAGDAADTTGYVLPDSDKRLYTYDELSSFSNWELKVAHNEIFARHGREFQQPELAEHFAACSWYTPRYAAGDYDAMPSLLNSYEQANSDLLAAMRMERGDY